MKCSVSNLDQHLFAQSHRISIFPGFKMWIFIQVPYNPIFPSSHQYICLKTE